MKTTSKAVGDRLPCGKVSLKMFQKNHSKALIIAYLDLRSGPKFPKYTFNQTDISNQTNIGLTVVRQYLKELVDEGVLIRKGKSFYKLDRQKMEALYYSVSESDLNASDSDAYSPETDANPSESDTDASESDAIHSSNLHSSKLHTRELQSTATAASQVPELAEKIPTVSGLGSEPLEKVTGFVSGLTARPTTPATDTKRRPSDSGSPKEGESHPQPSLTVPSIEGQAAERKRKEIRGRLHSAWITAGRQGEWPPPDLGEQVERLMWKPF